MAQNSEEADHDGQLFAVTLKVHEDPNKRMHQYRYLMQLIEKAFGPREAEEFQMYFNTTLTLQ